MNVGQVTFFYSSSNYGQILQAYALQKVLNSRGHNCFLVNHGKNITYSLRDKFKRRVLAFFNYLDIPNFSLKSLNAINRAAQFNKFKEQHLQLGPYVADITKSSFDADCFITGSDQVWNHSLFTNVEKELRFYFLTFIKNNEIPAFSYAASFGFEKLDSSLTSTYKELIKKLKKVSVREESGKKISTELGVENALVVPDPTLLLSKEDWKNLLQEKKSTNLKKKVFIYSLEKDFEIFLGEIKYLRPNRSLEVIHVYPNHRLETHTLSIQEWLQEISEASYVITNSFHGTVFSIIFEKPFITCLRTGSASISNDRVISLLNKLGLENQIAKDPSEFKEKLETINNSSIDWSLVKKRLDEFRKTGFDFLESIGL